MFYVCWKGFHVSITGHQITRYHDYVQLTRHSFTIVLVLGQRRRCWVTIKPTLGKRLVFAW